jgi:MYXO-CTERM domain-containing protein
MEYDEAYEQVSIDICNNDIEQATDDAIEADSARGNVRVFRNRITNGFDGISAQPNLGGPSYYVRNVMYNVLYSPFKFHNGTVGDIVLHNTVVKCGDGFGCYAGETWSRAVLRNNVFIGGTGGGTYGGYGNGTGRVLDLVDADASCSFDYDGLGSIGTGKFEGKIGGTRFTSVATMQSTTTEVHGIQVDTSIFAGQVAFPSVPFPPPAVPDLRLAAGASAVDKGGALVGINDGFAGAAPDLGAYEAGDSLPVYGPRSPSAVGTGGSSGSGGGPGPSYDGGGADSSVVPLPGTGGRNSGTGGSASGSGGVRAGTGGSPAGNGGSAPVGVGGAPSNGGAAVPDANTAKQSGCGCTVGSARRVNGAWVLAALALLRRRRRTRAKS